MKDKLVEKVVRELKKWPFVVGIVLGGSRATGTARRDSDYDIGIYYDPSKVDFTSLNLSAARLDDTGRENLIGPEKSWGPWVNCGGWLTIEGSPVDLIFRDILRAADCVDETDRGEISMHYQTGHPHAFLNVMYRGELASARVLYARDTSFTALKARCELYPGKLREALISFFSFEANFSCALAKKTLPQMDLCYIAGHLFRSVSALNQVLFALNETYCLNEKRAPERIDSFPDAPRDYQNRVESVLWPKDGDPASSIRQLEALCEDVNDLIQRCD